MYLHRMQCVFLSTILLLTGTQLVAQPSANIDRDTVSVPRLLENLKTENVRVSASAARTLGVVFAPGGRGAEELEKATSLLIERLDSPLGAALRRECARALGRMKAVAATEKMKVAMRDDDIEVAMEAEEPLVALAFKVQLFEGRRHVFTRLYRGTLEPGQEGPRA